MIGGRELSESEVDVPCGAATHEHWRMAQALLQVVGPCRFNIGSVVVGLLALLGPEQSRECMRLLCEESTAVTLLSFFVALLLWAHSAWYFARVLLLFRYPGQLQFPENTREGKWLRGAVRVVPRLLGVTPFLGTCSGIAALAYSAGPASIRYWCISAVVLALGLAFAAFMWMRRRALAWLSERYPRSKLMAQLRAEDEPPPPSLRQWRDLSPATLFWLFVQLGVFAATFLAFWLAPVSYGQVFGAPTVVLIASGTWIALGAALTYLGQWTQWPVLSSLLLWTLWCSCYNDNHLVDLEGAARPTNRPTVGEDFQHWYSALANPKANAPSERWAFVVTEGGGIRAAYWTAAVLGSLETQVPGFSKHLYGISSVSGGSVGAGMFVAALSTSLSGQAARNATLQSLALDSLGPVLGKGLFPDLVQRAIPHPFESLDRGTALEGSWSTAFERTTHIDRLSRPFDEFYANDSSLPRLFLNSTVVETGRRAVVSYSRFLPSETAALQVEQELGSGTLVQAMHMSARFALVSPAARVVVPEPSGQDWLHLVDGGYYDNSGAATALEILSIIERGGASRPTVIVISFEEASGGHKLAFAPELISPLQTVVQTRVARSREAIAALRSAHRTVQFRLANSEIPLPLGWVLSRRTRDEIERQFGARMDNREALAEVRTALSL